MKVSNSTVTGNSVQSNGGGIYADNMNLGDFTSITFKNNVAGTGKHNALLLQSAAATLCSFQAERAHAAHTRP